MRQYQHEESEKFSELQDNKIYQCMNTQVKYLAYSYVLFSVSDVILLFVGNVIHSQGEIFICTKSWYMMSESPEGSVFILVDYIFLYLFSILIWFIFYRLPDKYGLLGHTQAQDLKMSSSTEGSINTSSKENKRNNSQVIVDFMRMSQDFDNTPLINNVNVKQRKSSVQLQQSTLIQDDGLHKTLVQRHQNQLSIRLTSPQKHNFRATQIPSHQLSSNQNLISSTTTAGFVSVYNPTAGLIEDNSKSVVNKRKKRQNIFMQTENKGSMLSHNRKTSPYRDVE
ncbi:UNKNOWN [Stylonychia lemnae]|uniref:Transmembrane protein n=1 Tax=Stylonychia lemnae TaxID=5949 RepID=A0A078A4A9_STYLE|nr:UNKNOWN [Stylonychia lemnae]|eukprot:CDW76323.1 UNKNOWN [Stylonychia lemnae]